jgi:hypothetical protein
MFIRKIAAVGLAAGLLIGTSACGAVTPIATLQEYAPSDGVQADFTDVKLRNFMYLTDNEGHAALFGSIVNSGVQKADVKLQYTDANSSETKDVVVSVLAGQKLDIGYNGNAPLNIALAGKAGEAVTIYASTGNETAATLDVPILDGTLSEYKDLVAELKNLPAAN